MNRGADNWNKWNSWNSAVMLLSLMVSVIPAQAADWVSTGGPLGGLGYDVRIHPQRKTTMYVTDNYAGVARSDDAGASWRAANDGISVRGGPSGSAIPIFSLTVDPNNPSILWAGTNGEGGKFGVFKSTDGGTSWSLKTNGITASPFGLVFRGFTVQAGNSEVVYAMAEVPSDIQGREFNRVHGRAYKTVDGGQSWSLLWQGDNLARYLIIDPGNSAMLYLSTGIFDREAYNSDCAAGNSGGVGVLKSTNGGLTWTAINSGLTNLYVGGLRMHPSNSQILFAAAGNNACSGGFDGNEQGGLFRTTDGGATWAKVISRDIMTTVNFAPSSPAIVYAGSAAAFYRSSDGGLTWSRYDKPGTGQWGPEGVRAGVPIDVTIDPDDPNLLYANNYGGGVFRSTDGARTWAIWSKGYSGAQIHVVHIPPASPSTVLAIGRSGPFRSVNYGSDWTGIGTGQASFAEWNTLVTDSRDARIILMADEHQGKIVRSTDAGASFAIVFTHPQANATSVTTRQGFKTFAVAASNPDTIYAGVARERGTLEQSGTPAGRVLYKSTDNGRSFAAAGAALDGKNVRRLVVHSTQADTVWAATSGGVYRSADGGANWTLLGLAGKNIVALAVDGAVLVASEKEAGIWFSEDAGNNWSGPSTIGINNPNPYVMALTFDTADTAGTLYAADYYSGAYSSTDHGRSWRAFPDTSMTGLAMRSAKDVVTANGLVYVATEGGGVFRNGTLPSAQTPYSITGTATGALSARALSVSVQPTLAELGTSRRIFIAGILGSQVYFLTASGWQSWTSGEFPAYASGAIANQTIRVFDGRLDLTGVAGAQIYVGYGIAASDMLATGRYARVHTLQ